jgi:hypothetical protein
MVSMTWAGEVEAHLAATRSRGQQRPHSASATILRSVLSASTDPEFPLGAGSVYMNGLAKLSQCEHDRFRRVGLLRCGAVLAR